MRKSFDKGVEAVKSLNVDDAGGQLKVEKCPAVGAHANASLKTFCHAFDRCTAQTIITALLQAQSVRLSSSFLLHAMPTSFT